MTNSHSLTLHSTIPLLDPYQTNTWPDIAFTVNKLCQHLHILSTLISPSVNVYSTTYKPQSTVHKVSLFNPISPSSKHILTRTKQVTIIITVLQQDIHYYAATLYLEYQQTTIARSSIEAEYHTLATTTTKPYGFIPSYMSLASISLTPHLFTLTTSSPSHLPTT